ncbi:MAG: radical SAM protein, partial [Spirochaetales bacterium]|nr:radical SAM protein [Spirochaetales bacterium]
METLFGKTLNQLKKVAAAAGLKPFAAKQMAQWLYSKNIRSIDDMTNLSLNARNWLKENYTLGLHDPDRADESVDGTKKYLYHIQGTHFVETAYIPDDDRATLCVSSQVGCKMGCRFCMTGRQGYQYSLTAGEILNQLQSLPERERLSNLVYLGMGDPLANMEAVMD